MRKRIFIISALALMIFTSCGVNNTVEKVKENNTQQSTTVNNQNNTTSSDKDKNDQVDKKNISIDKSFVDELKLKLASSGYKLEENNMGAGDEWSESSLYSKAYDEYTTVVYINKIKIGEDILKATITNLADSKEIEIIHQGIEVYLNENKRFNQLTAIDNNTGYAIIMQVNSGVKEIKDKAVEELKKYIKDLIK